MEGYLKKYSNFLWWDKYFILHEDCLHYCDQKGGQIKGTIHLKIANIIQLPDDPLRIIINTGISKIEIKTASELESKKWLQKLQQAQDFAKSQFDTLSLEQLEELIRSNKNLDPEYKKMLLTSNNQKIERSLVEVYENGAKIDETIFELIPSIKNDQEKKLIDNLQKYTHQMKKSLQDCIISLENERKRLYRTAQLIQTNIETNNMEQQFVQKLANMNEKDRNFSFDEEGDKTIYESFIGDDTYFYKMQQSQCILEDLQQEKTIQNQQIIPQAQLISFFKDKCQVKYNLLTTNPAYLATEISDDLIRKKLPKEKDPNEKINIWSILKDSIGKDLSKFAVPVYLNEPISMLQRLAEQMEYQEVLDKANSCDDSCLALCYTMGFGASVYSGTINRTKKPFNPLLGETFEFVDEKAGYRFISEQVSHHPPISAGIGESNSYIFEGDSSIKTAFWGKSFEIKPQGRHRIFLKRKKWEIVYKKCTTAVKNIFIGQMFVDHYGIMEFQNLTTGDQGELKFKEKGAWSEKGQYEIEGWVKNKNKEQTYTLKGHWNNNLVCQNIKTGESQEIWKRNALPVNSDRYYHYTNFALQLNHLSKENIKYLCPTDSRLRPDQRALEYGLLDIASDEKLRLEQKQRARRKENELMGKQHQIVFFEQKIDPVTQEIEYKYKGGYWEAREKQDWSQLPILDLY